MPPISISASGLETDHAIQACQPILIDEEVEICSVPAGPFSVLNFPTLNLPWNNTCLVSGRLS
jgi:hypothetical protein